MFVAQRSYIVPYTAAHVASPSVRHSLDVRRVGVRTRLRLNAPPFAHRVERAWESRRTDTSAAAAPRPTRPESSRRAAHDCVANRSFVAGGDDRRQPHERARCVVECVQDGDAAGRTPSSIGVQRCEYGCDCASAVRRPERAFRRRSSPRVLRTGRRRNSSRRGGSVGRAAHRASAEREAPRGTARAARRRRP